MLLNAKPSMRVYPLLLLIVGMLFFIIPVTAGESYWWDTQDMSFYNGDLFFSYDHLWTSAAYMQFNSTHNNFTDVCLGGTCKNTWSGLGNSSWNETKAYTLFYTKAQSDVINTSWKTNATNQLTLINGLKTSNGTLFTNASNQATRIQALYTSNQTSVKIGSANKTKSYCGNITGSNVNLCSITTGSTPHKVWENTTTQLKINKSYPQNILLNGSLNITGQICTGTATVCMDFNFDEAGCLAQAGCNYDFDPDCGGTETGCPAMGVENCENQDGCSLTTGNLFNLNPTGDVTTLGQLQLNNEIVFKGADVFGLDGGGNITIAYGYNGGGFNSQLWICFGSFIGDADASCFRYWILSDTLMVSGVSGNNGDNLPISIAYGANLYVGSYEEDGSNAKLQVSGEVNIEGTGSIKFDNAQKISISGNNLLFRTPAGGLVRIMNSSTTSGRLQVKDIVYTTPENKDYKALDKIKNPETLTSTLKSPDDFHKLFPQEMQTTFQEVDETNCWQELDYKNGYCWNDTRGEICDKKVCGVNPKLCIRKDVYETICANKTVTGISAGDSWMFTYKATWELNEKVKTLEQNNIDLQQKMSDQEKYNKQFQECLDKSDDMKQLKECLKQ